MIQRHISYDDDDDSLPVLSKPLLYPIFRFDSNELVGSMFPIYIIAIPF